MKLLETHALLLPDWISYCSQKSPGVSQADSDWGFGLIDILLFRWKFTVNEKWLSFWKEFITLEIKKKTKHDVITATHDPTQNLASNIADDMKEHLIASNLAAAVIKDAQPRQKPIHDSTRDCGSEYSRAGSPFPKAGVCISGFRSDTLGWEKNWLKT